MHHVSTSRKTTTITTSGDDYQQLAEALKRAERLEPPVSVTPVSASKGIMHRMRRAQNNLLSVWREEDYSIRTSRISLMNQDYVLCNSPDTVRRIFLEQHDNYDRKSPQMRRALEPLLDDGLFVSDGDLWRQRRRQCAPSLTNALLPGFCTTMTASAEETAKRWAQHPSDAPIDMLTEMAHLTARIIGRTIFGDDTTDEEAEQVVAGFTEYQRHSEHLDMANMLGLPFLSLLGNPLRRARTRYSAKQVHEIIDRIIDRHTQRSGPGQHSLVDSFMASMKDGEDNGCPMGRKAVRNEAIVMFMAGHETTANALAWCWYLLDYDRQAMARLQHELDEVLGGRTPCYEDVAKLPYTMAVFEEAMRLYPPVPMLSRQARGNDKVRNRDVREGTVLLVSPWLLHRHRKLWEAPDHFVPERFLPEAPRPDKFAYLPFSVGPRVCLGKRFGLYEGVLCLATLAQHFTPKLVPDHQVSIECRLTLRPQGGLPMMLQPR
ncbi:cytochrome P450 [Halomonas sp. TD01]|uniref:cytochrome P450 n=1 Tax=Halomonas sp. TD01 TaxID=999141 RepID=UPI000214F998|nr:cytochrome P450 [Halomonas sp. TD01]EGP18773.1 cytochrome P450 [Halomonas sp. TD01]CAH1042207.1 Cytochrome P450 family protein [Halomonas sp. TD01]